MNFLTLASERTSIRKYENKEIANELIDKILEAGRIAPTSGNTQCFKILVINTPEKRNLLKDATNFYEAPLIFIICSDHTNEWKRPFDGKSLLDIDASIVTDHMMLEAADLGLGSVWICYFNPHIIKANFNLPDEYEPINLLAVGYSSESQPINSYHQKRKSLHELLI